MTLPQLRRFVRRLLFVIGFISLLNGHVQPSGATVPVDADETAVSQPYLSYIPLIADDAAPLLCRFGVNALGSLSQFDAYSLLRAGWYANYGSSPNPHRPSGTQFVQTLRFSQVGADAYAASKTPAQIEAIATAVPGSAWLIGNEPDRKDFQDDLEPHVYAKAYHDSYQIIKNADPTAEIYAGTIVQPTPIRLIYLDLVLESYQTMYGTALPVDGWSIHNFILNEVSCEYDSTNCWGADVPPGVDVEFGEILTLEDNKNVDLFKERIVRFRQWMLNNGYGGAPLMLSEYGVLIPESFAGFGSAEVNKFMNATFDYLLAASDPLLGNPNDNNRLIQQFAWYSTGASFDIYNGYLFDPDTKQLSPMGQNYVDYTENIPSQIDLYPAQVTSRDAGSGQITLDVTIANGGNLVNLSPPTAVSIYSGNPDSGGTLIGEETNVSLPGCGRTHAFSLSHTPAADETIYVVVDEQNRVDETNESNNRTAIEIEIP